MGDQYNSDAGKQINYVYKSKYFYFDDPVSSKRITRYNTISDMGDEAHLYFEYDKNKNPHEVAFHSGVLTSEWIDDTSQFDFKLLSYEIRGATTTNRGTFESVLLKVKQQGEKFKNSRGK